MTIGPTQKLYMQVQNIMENIYKRNIFEGMVWLPNPLVCSWLHIDLRDEEYEWKSRESFRVSVLQHGSGLRWILNLSIDQGEEWTGTADQ